MWSLGQPLPNFTLEGHEKGVNCVDYFTGACILGERESCWADSHQALTVHLSLRGWDSSSEGWAGLYKRTV